MVLGWLLTLIMLVTPLATTMTTSAVATGAIVAAAAPATDQTKDHQRDDGKATKRHDRGKKADHAPGKPLAPDKCAPGKLKHLELSDRCTHGPDPAPPGFNIHRSVQPLTSDATQRSSGSASSAVATQCDGDGVTGNRVQVLYARASDRADRYSNFLSSIRQWAANADQIFQDSAAETGGNRRLRFVTDASCNIVVLNIVMGASGDNNFDNSINELEAKGYNRTDRIYLMFVDTTAAGICGIGTMWGDDRAGSSNPSNRGPSYARVDAGCWDGATAAHEVMHNLGGVQDSAPNTSRGGHCVDEWDLMCYSDSPYYPDMRIRCQDSAHDELFDCNHNDYFHTSPAANSYLDTHWNTANNSFLIADAVPPPPPPSCPDDATEPDDTAGQARSFTVGATAGRAFCSMVDDHDWVFFSAAAGAKYRIETINLASGVDTVLDLYFDDGMTRIDSDDDSNGGRASVIIFTAPATGSYLLRARDYTGSDGSTGATFDLRIALVTSVDLGITSGKVDQSVDVSVGGFPASSVVDIQWDGVTQTQVTTDGNGIGATSFIVPSAVRGAHTVDAVAGTVSATTSFRIVPSLLLSPSSGSRGEQVGVSLTGYAAGESVVIKWFTGRKGIALKSVVVSADGDAKTSITVPVRTRLGKHKVQGGDKSGSKASAIFTVTSAVASAAQTTPEATTGPAPTADAPPGETSDAPASKRKETGGKPNGRRFGHQRDRENTA